MIKQIETPGAQSAPGLLSQAIITDQLPFTSGFIHLTAEGKLIEGSVEARFSQVIKNIETVLKAANCSLADVIKVTLYVTDISELPEINKLYTQYFSNPLPVREAVCVKALPLGASIEMSVVGRAR